MMSNTGIEPGNMRGVAATALLSFVDEWKEERRVAVGEDVSCHACICVHVACCRLTFPLLCPHLTKKKKILRLDSCCHTMLVSVFPVLTVKDVSTSVPTPPPPIFLVGHRKGSTFFSLLCSFLSSYPAIICFFFPASVC